MLDHSHPYSSSQKANRTSGLVEQFILLEQEWLEKLKVYAPQLNILIGEPIEALPDISFEAAIQKAHDAEAFLLKLTSINKDTLPHSYQLSYDILLRQLRELIEAPKYHYLKFNVTPYQLGFTISGLIPEYLKVSKVDREEDLKKLSKRWQDVLLYLQQLLEKCEEQTQQGIYIPKRALNGVQKLLQNIHPILKRQIHLTEKKLNESAHWDFQYILRSINLTFEQKITPTIERLLSIYGYDYTQKAPLQIGLCQYPGGKAYYQFLIQKETTLDLSPEVIHEMGIFHLQTLEESMSRVRQELGFKGNATRFHQKLRNEQQLYLSSPNELAKLFEQYIHRIEPFLDLYFENLPNASYGVKRMNPANEAGMTFGYYQPPNREETRGLYRYNGSDLNKKPMIWPGPLIYHELVPGHHFHLATQQENGLLSTYRKQGNTFTAFNEGWANYAASLAVELDLLPDPLEKYGWLLFDCFITVRLIVDTGINFFGWTFDQAKKFMLDHTFQSEQEVESELLRYGTDIPAQALSYKLGFEHIKNLREQMEKTYGEAFSIKSFHSAVLGEGALPMDILTEHVKWEMELNHSQ